jgi:hypothetical protein
VIKFSEFLLESHDPFHNRSIGLMSAERGNLAPQVNAHRTRALHSDLRAAGHKVVPVDGGFIENHGTPEAREVKEKSFLVMHRNHGDDGGAVKKTLIHMGKKYGQDSVLHKPHNSDVASLHGTNNSFPGLGKVHPVGKYRQRDGDQMFTRMPSGREFTFKEALNETYKDQFSQGGWDMYGHAANYAKDASLPHINPEMQDSNSEKQKPIAHAYHVAASGDEDYKQNVFKAYQRQHPDMVKDSGAIDYDSLTKASYGAMERETGNQYDHLKQHIKFDYHDGDKNYKDSNAMRDDLHNNKHMDVYKGGDEHEFLNKKDAGSDINSNHKFRAVHDAFGHGILKNGFGPKGEETAWHIHSQMYSPLARAAMSSETRGQNSWVNYSGVNAGKSPKDTTYAKQKSVLLPPEMNRSDYNGEVPHYLKKHMNTPITESNLPVPETRKGKNLREIVPDREKELMSIIESLSDTRSTYQKMKDLHDHPTTEPHLKASAAQWLSKNKPVEHSAFKDRDFGRWNSKKTTTSRPEPKPRTAPNPESHKKYHKMATDFHNYSYKGASSDTSGSSEEDHTVHNYTHMKGHKVELHMDPEQNHVDHWYHINKEHKATKGKGFDNLNNHLKSEYHKMWS